ncbi:MAG: hypothetical protein AB1424_15970 [Thermodesulfobacteriota bacterium]
MKLLTVKQARSIWLTYLIDLNPRGLDLLALIPIIRDKYRFLELSPTIDKINKETKEVKFGLGNLQKNKLSIGVDLSIYNDGLIADTRSSTNDSDAFLDEFLNWVSTEFGFMPYQEVLRTKLYISELVVQTEKSLNTLNPKLVKFAKHLNSLILGHEHQPIAFQTTGILFWTDPTAGNNPPGPFRFERLIDTPFRENRYYSAAPLQTEVHYGMLEELENILSS